MHAFESQVPDIAAVKIDGLAKFYGMKNPEDYEFFSVHQKADIYHSQAEWAIIERFADTPENKLKYSLLPKKLVTHCGVFWMASTKLIVQIWYVNKNNSNITLEFV